VRSIDGRVNRFCLAACLAAAVVLAATRTRAFSADPDGVIRLHCAQ
jgi:hypothetical protein